MVLKTNFKDDTDITFDGDFKKENIFKYEIFESFNNSKSLKIWSNSELKKVMINGQVLNADEMFFEYDKFVSVFNFNRFLKGQILSENKIFSDINFSFVPSFLVENDHIDLVKIETEDEYVFDEKKILKIDEKKSPYEKIRINFNAKWKNFFTSQSEISHVFSTFSPKYLERKLPGNGTHNCMRIIKNTFQKLNENFDFNFDGSTATISPFYQIFYRINFLYWFTIFRKESLSFEFQVNSDSQNFSISEGEKAENTAINFENDSNCGSQKIINFSMNLPDNPVFNEWSANNFYVTGDNVFFGNQAYSAVKDHSEIEFNSENWKKIDSKKSISFVNCFSFFESEYGKQVLQKLRKILPLFIEENIGDSVKLNFLYDRFLPDQRPNLNQFFKFKNKKFRIVQIHEKFKADQVVLEVTGQEILNANFEKSQEYLEDYVSDYFDDSTIFDWKQDAKIPEYSVAFFDADKNSEQSLEGMKMVLPENLEITSKATLKMVNF